MVFWLGIQRSIFIRNKSKSKGKTFVCRFDMDGKLNLIKQTYKKLGVFPGSCHADDLGYLFQTFFSQDVEFQSMEFKTVKLMVRIIVSA